MMHPGSVVIDLDMEDIDFCNTNMNKIQIKPAFSEQIVNKKTGLPDALQMGEGEPSVLHRCAGRDISAIDALKRGVGAWYNKDRINRAPVCGDYRCRYGGKCPGSSEKACLTSENIW